MEQKKKIVLVGAGALGVYYASRIGDAAEIYVAARSDREAVLKNGGAYQIDSQKFGSYRFTPAGLPDGSAKPDFEPDYLFVCLKAIDGLDQPELCKNFVAPGTVIVIIENGLGNEAPFRRAFPENEIISAAAYLGVSRPEPGKVFHTDGNRLIFGNYPRSDGFSPALLGLCKLFEHTGIEVELTENILEKRWIKLLWNAVFNPLSVLGGNADTKQIMDNPAMTELAEDIMLELCSIAAAAGITITRETVDGILEYTRNFPPYKPSMLQDFLANRALEVEAILGEPLAVAEKFGIPAPKLKTVYALMTLICRKGNSR